MVGVGALAVLGALTVGGHSGNAGVATDVAGSGDAPAKTVFVEPTVSAMNMGATETPTTAPSAMATSMAVPAIKGGG